MIRILESCCRYAGSGVHNIGDVVDYESTQNEKALVEGGFAEYVTDETKTEKEDKTKKTTKEDKTKLQTKELKLGESEGEK